MHSLDLKVSEWFLKGGLLLNVVAWAAGSLNPLFKLLDFSGALVTLINAFFLLVLSFGYAFYRKKIPIVLVCFFIVCVVFVFSALLSDYFLISILKLLKFFVSCAFFILAFDYLNKSGRQEDHGLVPSWLLLVFRVLGAASVLSIILGVAWSKNQTGFNGALDHPQRLALYSGIWSVCEQHRIYKKKNLIGIFWAVLSAAFVFMSEARTAMGALIAASLYMFFLNQRTGMSFKGVAIIYIFIILGVVAGDKVFGVLQDSFLKRGDTSVVQGLKDSRGKLMLGSLQNFIENPMLGIGFQVSNGRYGTQPMEVEYSGGLPLSAPIEKGVFYSGMMEEVGIVGGGAFLLFLAFLSTRAKKGRKVVFIYWALINFGEAIFFSVGGLGGLLWIVFSYNVTQKKEKWG